MLADTDEVLKNHSIEYWLDCGTLLGAIRDNELISWDKDIDLGCWKTANDYEIKSNIKPIFEDLGYEVFLADHYLNIHFKHHPDLNMDLNFYTIEDDHAVTPSSSLYPFLNDPVSKLCNHILKSVYNKKFYLTKYSTMIKVSFKALLTFHNKIFEVLPQNIKARYLDFLIDVRKNASKHKAEVVPKAFFHEVIASNILGGTYMIPKESRSYLEYRYGENWEVPDSNWDTFTQDGTVK